MAFKWDGEPIRPKAIMEWLVDYIAALLAGGFVWSLLVTDGPLKEQWFGIACSVAVFAGVAKYMRSVNWIDK